jgi:cobalt-zinc-cadmium efflux system protein
MPHDHVSVAGRSQGRLLLVLGLTLAFLAVEGVAAILTHSLVLLADAGHMLTDVVALSLALVSIRLAQRPANPRKTYGYYRFEILAALANALLLFSVSAFILIEAYRRFRSPAEVDSLPMLAVACAGLAVNLIGAGLLMKASRESLNVRGAFLELASDLLGSVGAIAAGIVILTTGWRYADPLFAAALGLFILPRTWSLMRASLDVLLEGTPGNIPVRSVQEELLRLPGIVGLHDLHVWTITSGFVALSAHAVVTDDGDRDRILIDATTLLHDRYDIEHVTLQLETLTMAEALQQPCLPDETSCYTDTIELMTQATGSRGGRGVPEPSPLWHRSGRPKPLP